MLERHGKKAEPVATEPVAAEGASAGLRAQASLKGNETDKIEFLRQKLGPENVRAGKNTTFVKEGGKWKHIDPDTGAGAEFLKGLLASGPASLVTPAGGGLAIAEGIRRAIGKGDVAGDIADEAGDIVSGAGLASPLNAISPALGSGATGAFNSELVRQGASALMPGKETMTPNERISKAGVNAVAEIAGEGAGALGGFALKKAARALSPTKRLVGKVAAEGAGEAVGTLTGEGVESFTKKSLALQKVVSDEIGEKFTLDAAQATGSPSALMAKRTLEQMPETMERMARDEQKRLLGASKFLDAHINSVAADPKKLGNSDVGGAVAKSVERYMEGLRATRTAEAGKYFKQADEKFGKYKVVDTAELRSFLDATIRSMDVGADADVAGLKAVRQKLEENATNGKVSVGYAQSLLSHFGDKLQGGTIAENISRGQQRRIAGGAMDAISRGMDSVPGEAGQEAVAALRKGRALWREHSAAIDSAGSDAVKRILKIAQKGDVSQIPASVLRNSSPEEIGGIVKILETSDPAAAKQLRANTMRNLFEASGKAPANAPFGAELRGTGFQPGKLIRLVEKNHDKLAALLGGDKAAVTKMRHSLELADRLSAGPGIKGSDTAPKQMFAAIIRGAPMQNSQGLGGRASAMVAQAIEKRIFDPENVYKLLSAPDGIDAFHALTTAAARPTHGAEATAAGFTAALARVISLQSEYEQDDSEPQPATVNPRRLASSP
jgi:hypothetical protein